YLDLLALTRQVSRRRTRFTREREIHLTVSRVWTRREPGKWRRVDTRGQENCCERAYLGVSRQALTGIGCKLASFRQGHRRGRHEREQDQCRESGETYPLRVHLSSRDHDRPSVASLPLRVDSRHLLGWFLGTSFTGRDPAEGGERVKCLSDLCC